MFNANNEYKPTPCRPEPCDYDCGSDDDITDKDLAVLLKEEAEKVGVGNAKTNDADKNQEAKENKENEEKEKEYLKKKDLNKGETEREKKRPCRKIIKNPFFTDRLKFSTDLPPRPPVPPPQFFPLAEEDSKPKVCSKKKKCKKKKGIKDDLNAGRDGLCEEEGGGEEECGGDDDNNNNNGSDNDNVCTCCDDDNDLRPRRRCRKSSKGSRGPCRKKSSDVSIPPQPRRIPALLKDPPLTCPQDLPEVERQIWMSRDNSNSKSICKKKCKKKETVEQLLNQ